MGSKVLHSRLRALLLGIGFLALEGSIASEALAQEVNILRGRIVDPPHVRDGSNLHPGVWIKTSADAFIVITTRGRACTKSVVLGGANTYQIERPPNSCKTYVPPDLPDPQSIYPFNVSVTFYPAGGDPKADTAENPDERRFRRWLSELKGSGVNKPPLAQERVFKWPKVNGYLVDICLHWGQACEEPAATAWCRQRGFRNATGWQIAEDIGDHSPTMVIGDNQICDQQFCDGFSEIRCGN